jgi:uncharacterized integral membrane protein
VPAGTVAGGLTGDTEERHMAQEPRDSGRPASSTRDNRDIVRLVVLGIAVILLIAFIIGNSASVKVNFVFFDTKASLIWVIIISALLGVIVDRLAIVLNKRRKSRK